MISYSTMQALVEGFARRMFETNLRRNQFHNRITIVDNRIEMIELIRYRERRTAFWRRSTWDAIGWLGYDCMTLFKLVLNVSSYCNEKRSVFLVDLSFARTVCCFIRTATAKRISARNMKKTTVAYWNKNKTQFFIFTPSFIDFSYSIQKCNMSSNSTPRK